MANKKNLTGEEQALRLVVEGTVADTGTEYPIETQQVRSHTNVNALTNCAVSKL